MRFFIWNIKGMHRPFIRIRIFTLFGPCSELSKRHSEDLILKMCTFRRNYWLFRSSVRVLHRGRDGVCIKHRCVCCVISAQVRSSVKSSSNVWRFNVTTICHAEICHHLSVKFNLIKVAVEAEPIIETLAELNVCYHLKKINFI